MLHLQGAGGLISGEVRRAPFADWLARVDREMIKLCGLTHSDVEDWPWMCDYNIGTTPREAARGWWEEFHA